MTAERRHRTVPYDLLAIEVNQDSLLCSQAIVNRRPFRRTAFTTTNPRTGETFTVMAQIPHNRSENID